MTNGNDQHKTKVVQIARLLDELINRKDEMLFDVLKELGQKNMESLNQAIFILAYDAHTKDIECKLH